MAESLDATIQLGPPVKLPTEFGDLLVLHFVSRGQEGVVVMPTSPLSDPVPVRVHSSCLFSEAFRATNCECVDQLHVALRAVVNERGVVIYQYQEGRGAGLRLKMEAIRHQQETQCDTAQAYRHLGITPDPRDHQVAAAVLKAVLGFDRPLILLTNNPGKVDALRAAGLNVVGRRSVVCRKNEIVNRYLEEKGKVLGHHMDDDTGDAR